MAKDKRKRISRRLGPRRHTFLVEGWQRAWKWLSVQAAAAIGSAAILYEELPQVKDYVPAKWFHFGMVLGAVGVIVARLKNQAPRK